ncbi:N-acetylglucosamine-6-phosphate deacetylase [Irregularibacter muris]|jgi:N-acetylglucosamine-6-phosphate deacetylase|uniref:N-acetylglucosamine-6-phosphate deacetylase n=1 Tax=Irregularibacter muris TaxID=1796619 RepID=A0AAE3KZJ4_9FIRM|nr:N-acetylglucosamine-6-phosphate deacetylase [Irregularibacter muris]MCR1898382.1 N-acetylglucosamine-6-phosphate deacetylase [Irregularibacter muris]
MKAYRFSKIFTGYTHIDKGVITVDDGKIISVEPYDGARHYSNLDESYKSFFAIPGFIDTHNHGGYGIDFMEAYGGEISELMKIFPMEGITTVIPTIGAMKDEGILRFIQIINNYMEKKERGVCDVLGTNIEGPFLNPEKAGLQPEGAIILPDVELTEKWLKASCGNMKIMTIAPELPGAADVIRVLKKNNVVISAGHSNATMIEMNLAIELGCNQITHLFNGMRSLHHREPGILGVGLCNDNIYAEMAGFDTYSIHPEIWKMMYKLKGPNRVILTTDALILKGLPDGKYRVMDREVEIKNGRLYTNYDGGNMHPGVPMSLIDCFKNVIKYTGATITDAITMASVNPAKQTNLIHRKGTLTKGKDADFIVMDESYSIISTYCAGICAYKD